MSALEKFTRVYTELHGHEPTDWQLAIGEALVRGESVHLAGQGRTSQKRQAQRAYRAFEELLKRPEFVRPQVVRNADDDQV